MLKIVACIENASSPINRELYSSRTDWIVQKNINVNVRSIYTALIILPDVAAFVWFMMFHWRHLHIYLYTYSVPLVP
jgi:hypothetical protein